MNTKHMLTWSNITYRTLLDIREAANIEDENERVYAIMEAVFGEDILDLPLKDFNEKCKELQFLQKEIPNDLHVKDIKVNGREYYFDGLLGKITTAQYIDFQNYQKNNDEQKSFSVFIIPKGHKYNDGYDMDQVFKDILDMPVPVLFSASFFFLTVVRTIHQNFPTLFNQIDEEAWATEGSNREYEESGESINGDDANPFGILPFVMTFIEVTNHTLEEAMNYDVATLFYIVSYQVMVNKKKEEMIKKMQKQS